MRLSISSNFSGEAGSSTVCGSAQQLQARLEWPERLLSLALPLLLPRLMLAQERARHLEEARTWIYLPNSVNTS